MTRDVTINRRIGVPPESTFVNVNLIDVDRQYQRALREVLVNRILRKFQWSRFGAIVLAKKNGGRFMVVEGQHRVEAAKRHPDINAVPAVVFEFASLEEEAKSFVGINRDRQAVSSVDRYWAAVTAGNPTALHVAAILKKAECDIVREHGAAQPGHTHAVTALERSIKNFGDEATVRALRILCATWPDDKDALRGTLITAVAGLVRFNPKLVDADLSAALCMHSFKEMTANAETIRKMAGGSSEVCLRRAIADLFNRGKSRRKLSYQQAA